jgi:hypothetical protein
VTAFVAAAVFNLAAATAFWVVAGTGVAAAAVDTLGPPTLVSTVLSGADVEVDWEPASVPMGASVTGYSVVRISDGQEPACGSSPEALLPASATSCIDTAPPAGTYRYRVVAVLNSWTAASVLGPEVTIEADVTPPEVAITLVDEANAYLADLGGVDRVYFRSAAGGGFRLAAEVTDEESGPASVTFPDINNSNWVHLEETVTAGSGSPPTVTYTSSPFNWNPAATAPATRLITARDVAGNSNVVEIQFRDDNNPPTGGALTVNGVAAAAGPASTSTNSSGTFPINVRTDFGEDQSSTQSGLASSTLVRESATLSLGTCGTFSDPVGIDGSPEQGPLESGCYRYTLSGVDRVGNQAPPLSTIVRVDTTPPISGALSANGVAATVEGSSSVDADGSWPLTRTDWVDPESGPVTSALTAAAGTIVNGECTGFGAPSTIAGAPSQSGSARQCFRYALTGTNAFGESSTVTTTVAGGPFIRSLTLENGPGGTPGRVEQGDRIVAVYSQDGIVASSFCANWRDDAGDDGITGDNEVTVELEVSILLGEAIQVTASGCGLFGFQFADIGMGTNSYSGQDVYFRGSGSNRSTITWTAATNTLVITLGAPTNLLGFAISPSTAVVAASVISQDKDPSIENFSGRTLAGNFSSVSRQHF